MPANPTLKELAARVEALEQNDSRLAAIGAGTVAGTLIEPAIPETPMIEVFEVRSELTAATIVTCESRSDAGEECDRLNRQAKEQGIKHRGEDQRYAIFPVLVPDAAAGYEITVSEMKSRIDGADGEEREALIVELEKIEATNEAVNDGE